MVEVVVVVVLPMADVHSFAALDERADLALNDLAREHTQEVVPSQRCVRDIYFHQRQLPYGQSSLEDLGDRMVEPPAALHLGEIQTAC